MASPQNDVSTTLRIPGKWAHPGELIDQLPPDCRLTPETLHLSDGTEIEFSPMPPDAQFPQIFCSSCRQPPTEEERAIVNSYSVNVGLTGPGGSQEAAQTMMRAGAAILQAGGAGVFNDNSGLAHGRDLWLQMADDGSSDALSYAFVSIVSSEREVWTMGMHVLGLPEIVMSRSEIAPDAETVVEVVRYICRDEKPFGEGHIIADESGPRYQVQTAPADEQFTGTPMHNPFGRLRLSSLREIGESN